MKLPFGARFQLPKRERISPNYSRKISDVLCEFVEEIVPADSEPHILEQGVALAVLLWNHHLLPERAQAEGMSQIQKWLATAGRLDLQTEISRLLELRKTRYGSDRRIVAHYEVELDGKNLRLTVASADPDRQVASGGKPE